MSGDFRARHAIQRTKPRLSALRRKAQAATRRLTGRGHWVPDLVSVVVPAYGVQDYIGECLDSLCAQAYENVEIIVVDDGSPDDSAAIARERAASDPRIRVVSQENGGLSAARNAGVRHAVGEYLAFVDADDTVAHKVFSAPVEALTESGSDFAVTKYDRLDKDGKRAPGAPWIQDAHERRRLRTSLDEFPDAMVNAVAWSKVFRRTFWDAAELEFPVGRLYEDQPVSMAAFSRADAFDVLPNLGVHWRVRGDGSSISQAAASIRNIVDHNEAVRTSLHILRTHATAEAADQRVLQLLANNMPFFVRHVITAGDEYWQHLRDGISDLVTGIRRETYLREVPALEKVLYELIVSDRRAEANGIIEEYGRDVRRYPTQLREDGLHVVLPYASLVPDEVTRLADRQLILVHKILHTSWQDDGRLRLGGWAYIENVDLGEHPQSVDLTLVGADGFTREIEVVPEEQPRADFSGHHDFCDYTRSGFAAFLDASDLPDGDYRFALRVESAGTTHTGFLDQPSNAGSAGFAHARILPGGRAMVLRQEKDRSAGRGRLLLRVTSRDAWARASRWDGTTLELDFEADMPTSVHLAHIDRPEPFVAATPTQVGDHWRVRLDLSELDGRISALKGKERLRPLRFRVLRGGESLPMLAHEGLDHSPGTAVGSQGPPHVLTRARTGELEVFDWLPVALGYEITDEELRVDIAHREASMSAPVLRGGGGTCVLGTVEPSTTGTRSTVRFRLRRDFWAHSDLALPRDRYVVGFVADDSSAEPDAMAVPLSVASDLLDSLPVDQVGDLHRVRMTVAGKAPPVLVANLSAPLNDDERGRRNQRRLQMESKVARAEDDSVFFRSLYGEVTNCNALGVHDELRHRGAALTLLWSVADRSVPVPDGGVGLVEGTAEWHRALARSRYHMVNVHQLPWFEKPEGQVLIQTMHGYPYKVMGHSWWQKGGFPAHQIASFDRRATEWDYFVSPAGYATPLLKDAFLNPAGARPNILEIGYPRNDVLVSPEADDVRRRTRALLGIDEGATVLLYAPTFRDYLSADDTTAKRMDLLDAEAVTREHENVVVLLRGHAFHARAMDLRESTGAVVDVTDYPDVNDLILASDVGVLDYSSLRFDYGVTDKPMIFLVPDLNRYHQARGGVIDYEPTAPGPKVSTTAEVVAWLDDMPRLRSEYASARSTFRRNYLELEDGRASARLVDAVFVPRGDARPRGEDQGSR